LHFQTKYASFPSKERQKHQILSAIPQNMAGQLESAGNNFTLIGILFTETNSADYGSELLQGSMTSLPNPLFWCCLEVLYNFIPG